MLFPLLSVVAPAAPELAARLATRALFTPPGRRWSARGDAFLATGVREDHDIAGQRIATWRWQPDRDISTSPHHDITTSPHHIATSPHPHIATSRYVLCLHGWGGSAVQFAAIVPALLARGVAEVPWDDGAAIARAWPDARLLSTEGLGHRRVLYDPTVADAVAAFIGGGGR